MTATTKRRTRGGSARAARHAQRQAGVSIDTVKPGQEGGQYKPLSDHDMQQIHDTALTILEEIGMGDHIPAITEPALARGAFLNEHDRLCFPRALIEEIIDGACKDFTHYAPNPDYDLHYSGSKVHFASSGEAVSILDYDTKTYRPSTLEDQYDLARLADQLPNIHSVQQNVIATEFGEDNYNQNINLLYAQLAGTQKPFAISTCNAEYVDDFIELMDIHLGGKGKFLERPICTFGGCPIVSPLRYGIENAEVLVKCAQLGLPYDIAIASMAGSTAPATLAGSLAQTFAEGLGALAAMNLVRPGNPIFMGTWPFISDLRTGSFTGGSGEEALASAAIAQLCNFYGLPSSVSAGMSDSKLPDAQSGYEKGITTALTALAGCNYIAEVAGMQGSLMGVSYEAMLIDNDMLGNVQRALRGIEVNEETLALDTIRNAVYGEGHFLNQPQTLSVMETEYLYPSLADRTATGEWEKAGSKDIQEVAHEKVKTMMSNYYPQYISPEADKKIRERFDIRLKPEDMQANNSRW